MTGAGGGKGTGAGGSTGKPAPGSIVVLQVIDVEYSKAARGGAAARLRATLPTTFPVPTSTSDVVHKVFLGASNGYHPGSHVDALGPVPPGPLLGGRVRLDRADDGAIVLVDSAGGARVVVDERWTQLRFTSSSTATTTRGTGRRPSTRSGCRRRPPARCSSASPRCAAISAGRSSAGASAADPTAARPQPHAMRSSRL